MSDIQFSKFMKTLVEEMENNKLSDKTIKNYIQRLYILNGRKKFTSLSFLRKHEDIIKYIKDNFSVATQKTYAGTISSILKLRPNKVNEKLIDYHFSLLSLSSNCIFDKSGFAELAEKINRFHKKLCN